MAQRPVFVPEQSGFPFVKKVDIEFKWFPGMAKSQTQKSIRSLHEAAAKAGYMSLLEISSKSEDCLGVSLSAFNLNITNDNKKMSVECAFQGSKVFEQGGPYTDLYSASSLDAKRDDRIRTSGEIIAFDFMGVQFPTMPITLFYDWLYITALHQNRKLAGQILEYDGFTDIAFNPQKSWNCQARSAALYLALEASGKLEQVVSDTGCYLRLATDSGKASTGGVQMGFGFGFG
jgi:hypothetical protein